MCVAEWYIVTQGRVDHVREEPWKVALFGKVSVLLNAKVEVVIL